MKKVAVIGAGVNGLGCAYVIQTQIPGVEVTIISEQFSPNTTGDGSAGFWETCHTGSTAEHLMGRWSDITYKYLQTLLRDGLGVEAGISQLDGSHIYEDNVRKSYWWRTPAMYREMTKKELEITPWAKFGEEFTSIACEPMAYLPWITKKFVRAGGKIVQHKVNDFCELMGRYDLVINCTGVGAYDLANDKEVFPMKGQIIKVRAPWIKRFSVATFSNGMVTYILPGQHVISLGGFHDANNWNTDIDLEAKESIWERCCRLEPSLKDAEFVRDWSGSRPCRPSIRLEAETIKDKTNRSLTVIHNYGHGGGGVTLHWGCALDVLKLAQEQLIAKESRL